MTQKTPSASRFPLPRWTIVFIATGSVLAGLLLPWVVTRAPAPAQSLPASASPEAESGELPAPDVNGLLTRLYLVAGVVLVLLVGGLFACRRWLRARATSRNNQQLQILGVARLDARSCVYLVQARGQRLLAGVDLSGLRLLVGVPEASEARRPGEGTTTPRLRVEL